MENKRLVGRKKRRKKNVSAAGCCDRLTLKALCHRGASNTPLDEPMAPTLTWSEKLTAAEQSQ